jgi:hypothetical protein
LAGFGMTCATAGLGLVLLAFTETEFCCEAPFALGCALAGLAVAAFTETAFDAGTGETLFVPVEIVFAFGFDTAGFPEACTKAVFAVETAGFTEIAGFAFGTVLAALAFAPFGEGLPVCAARRVAGCTLTVAGAAGFCTAVGVCANAAADRSMSVPRVRII